MPSIKSITAGEIIGEVHIKYSLLSFFALQIVLVALFSMVFYFLPYKQSKYFLILMPLPFILIYLLPYSDPVKKIETPKGIPLDGLEYKFVPDKSDTYFFQVNFFENELESLINGVKRQEIAGKIYLNINIKQNDSVENKIFPLSIMQYSLEFFSPLEILLFESRLKKSPATIKLTLGIIGADEIAPLNPIPQIFEPKPRFRMPSKQVSPSVKIATTIKPLDLKGIEDIPKLYIVSYKESLAYKIF